MGTGHAPAPWANGLYEIMVTDFPRSFAFWTNVLGFEPSFQRPEQKLAHLAHPHGAPHGAQMMLYERDGDWEVAPMQAPFGRGAVLQVFVSDMAAVARRVAAAGLPFYVEPREKWRDWGDCLGGQREFLVQDPDGYLVMVAERLGTRPLPTL